jgi:hypothetical protein
MDPKSLTGASLSRLATYGVAAASAAASSTASADVIYFNPADVTTPNSGAARLIYFNPSTGAAVTAPQTSEEASKYQFVLFGGTAGPPEALRAVVRPNAGFPNNDGLTLRTAPYEYVARLAGGEGIGAGGLFQALSGTLADGTYGYGLWNDLGRGYFGFSFGLSGNTHFGWAQISISNDYRVTLMDFAYESVPGATIMAGQTVAVPEPATTSLMAFGLGAAGLAAYRARRRAQAAAA